MHELSIARAVIDVAVRHAGGHPVTQVRLRVGQLRQVVPDTLAFYFNIAAEGTPCEGARLEQELVRVRLRCRTCAHEWAIHEPSFRCPGCGGADAELLAGEELDVESIEVEETACTA